MKLIVLVSELWSEEQVRVALEAVRRGVLEARKSGEISDWDQEQVESARVVLPGHSGLVGPLGALWECLGCQEGHGDAGDQQTLVVVHAGEAASPWGHWVAPEALVTPRALAPLSGASRRLVLCCARPSEDWANTTAFGASRATVCLYSLNDHLQDNHDDDEDERSCPGITKLMERVRAQLTVSKISQNLDISSMGKLNSRTPAFYVFVDQGSAAVPALLTLDGFAVLINSGFHRNSDLRRHLCFFNQLDVAILTHLSYTNLHGLTSMAECCEQQHLQQQQLSHRINHLLLPVDPASLALLDQSQPAPPHPLAVDLRYQLGTAIHKLRQSSGTHCSELAFKHKSAAKVIQLYYKIGCGKLDLIPLCPFEDDPEVKKFGEEWKKGRYSNDSSPKSVPASSSILLLWKPYNEKVPVKRVLYVGSKCSIKKYFPAAVTMIQASQDCVKQPEFIPADGISKKPAGPRKPTPTAAPVPSAAKPAKSTNENTKPSSAGPAANSKKPASRPGTATVPDGPGAPKESAKRPQTAAGARPRTEPVKQSQEGAAKKPAAASIPRPAATATATAPGAANKKAAPKTKPDSKGRPLSSAATKSQSAPATALVTAPAPAPKQVEDKAVPLANGDVAVAAHSNGIDAAVSGHGDLGDSGAAGGGGAGIVAVGTVECAITEHGEADFCDDTPEELSADQMRKMGLYGDEDEEREDAGAGAVGNLAHLPMEGSFYGKEPLDTMTAGAGADEAINHRAPGWTEPLALPAPPVPARDGSGAASKKAPAKPLCQSPIFVDYVCVPSDLESRDELDCLFECVRSPVVVAQLGRAADLVPLVEALLAARDRDGAAAQLPLVTVIPSCPVSEDRAWLDWQLANGARLMSAAVTVATDLTRHSLSALGDGGQPMGECRGARLEL